ncbi:MAG TPA: hypothetical protein GXX28_05565 [Firmicutes bacterium]|nr:hypothetical protein [Bacillota bacterium]
MSNLLVSKTTGNKVFVIAAPLQGPRGAIGVVHATFNFQSLGELVSKNKYGKTGYSFLLDHEGAHVSPRNPAHLHG